jgi:hypothetical protein
MSWEWWKENFSSNFEKCFWMLMENLLNFEMVKCNWTKTRERIANVKSGFKEQKNFLKCDIKFILIDV